MKAWLLSLKSQAFILLLFAFLYASLLPAFVSARTSQRSELQSQPCPLTFDVLEAERQFAIAAGKHQERFGRLLNSRGLRPSLDNASDLYLKNLRAALSGSFQKETAVLFYDEEEAVFRAWLIDREGVRAFHQGSLSRAQLDSAMAALRESLDVEDLAARRLPPRLRPQKSAALASSPHRVNPKALLSGRLSALASLLLPADIICQLKAVRHLIIVPILDIGTVPFAALRPFDSSASLIDSMSVTIAPSLFDIGRVEKTWSADFREPLFVGNPYLAPSAGWEPLHNAEREARFVGEMFKTPPLVGRYATREAILARASTADLLYFATHGAADATHPLEGGFLVFSGPRGVESLWTTREIQQTPLRARLAVLSACQTGLGKAHDAGVIGLARAFQLAGVPRVVMSLWSVYDDATAELMQAFARHLRQRHAPAEALRLAMLEVRRTRPDPAEWASFVIFGTPQ
ncbi:MAG TPA: CHAT domain-containing protein [Pyrinomonadaceae bacterium]|jgi:hypothetical protein